MKKRKSFLSMLSFMIAFVFALTGCIDGTIQYSKTNLDLLDEKITEVSTMFAEIANLDDAPISIQVEFGKAVDSVNDLVKNALVKAKITDKELGKLLNLQIDLSSIDEMNSLETMKSIVNTFYDTGITNRKIGTFIYAIFEGTRVIIAKVSNEVFIGSDISKAEILAEYDKVLGCATQEEFVNVFEAYFDSYLITLNSNIFESIMNIATEGLYITKNEVKTLIAETKVLLKKLHEIENDKVVNSFVSITKKVLATYTQEGMSAKEYIIIGKTLDMLVTYNKVMQKVDLAVLNAIDDAMLDVLFSDPTRDQVVIAFGKLIYAAIDLNGKGTGLTKKLILEFPILELVFGTDNINPSGLADFLDIIFEDAKAFKNYTYSSTVDYENNFLANYIKNFLEYGSVVPIIY